MFILQLGFEQSNMALVLLQKLHSTDYQTCLLFITQMHVMYPQAKKNKLHNWTIIVHNNWTNQNGLSTNLTSKYEI